MGVISDAAFTPRNAGGQKHKLHGVLANLSPEEATELRTILTLEREDENWTALAAAMRDRGFQHSVSTWQRWGQDITREPDRF